MSKLTGKALDRAVAKAMGLKSVNNCEAWVGLAEQPAPVQGWKLVPIDTPDSLARRLYQRHPYYRGTVPFAWEDAPESVRLEWLETASKQLAAEALDKMAENARELGLDYEPVWSGGPTNKDYEDAMRAKGLLKLTAALEQPAPVAKPHEQEPHSWYSKQEDEWMTHKTRMEHERLNSYTHKVGKFDLALYTTPSQPEQKKCDNCSEFGKCCLAQEQEQEPVAWMYESVCGNDFATRHKPPDYGKNIRPLYTTPPQRTWVNATTWRGLTDEDIRQCSRDVVAGGPENSVDRFAYAIEAKLKEKNNA